MKDVSQILYSLGFLDSEVKTYMAALEHGPRTVLELTKLTNLSRQAIYVVIESLTNRGIMSSVMRGKKRYYVAEEPEKLLSYARRKEQELSEKIKDLEHHIPEMKLRIGGERPTVLLYEGMEGLRMHTADMVESEPDVLYEFADLDAIFTILSREDFDSSIRGMKNANIHVKGIYAGAARGKTLSSERYFLPKELSGFKSSIALYNDKITIWSYEGKIYTVVIKNKTLANAFRIFFELALKSAKEFPSD